MPRLAGSRRSVPAVLAAFALLAACVLAVVHASAAHAEAAGPYPSAVLFRPDGVLASAPATVTLSDIGTAAFVLGQDDTIWWATPNTNWATLGMPLAGTVMTPIGIIGNPAVVSWGAGRIDLFVQGGDHKLWQRFTTTSGASWSPWIQPVGTDGYLNSPPAVTSWTPGRIDIVVQGTDHHLWQRDWDTAAWSGGWLDLGSPPVASQPVTQDPPTVTTFAKGRLDIFLTGADGRLWQTFFTNNTWFGWFQPPGTQGGLLNSAPAADWWNDGAGNSLTVFAQGVDNHLYQTTYSGTGWGSWTIEGAQGNVFKGQPQIETTFQFTQPIVLVWGTDNKCYGFLPASLLGQGVLVAKQFSASRAGFSSFTIIDTATQAVYSSPGSDTQIRSASVIKVPIAMALLLRADAQNRGLTAGESSNLRLMITQSDNNAATALWNEVGGSSVLAVMQRFGATSSALDPSGAWGFTRVTSHDLAAVLAGLAAQSFAGATTIIDLMHQVIPSQAWGIGAAVPGSAIKNGWYPDPGDWRVNCLGIVSGTRYTLAVTTQYPISLGQVYGEQTCQGIAARIFSGVQTSAPRAAAIPVTPAPVPAIVGIGMTADGG